MQDTPQPWGAGIQVSVEAAAESKRHYRRLWVRVLLGVLRAGRRNWLRSFSGNWIGSIPSSRFMAVARRLRAREWVSVEAPRSQAQLPFLSQVQALGPPPGQGARWRCRRLWTAVRGSIPYLPSRVRSSMGEHLLCTEKICRFESCRIHSPR